MNGADSPPANPTSLGNVWTGETRPTFVAIESEMFVRGLDELQRLRAMERRLLEWADQLGEKRDEPDASGKSIVAELRNRMTGRSNSGPHGATAGSTHETDLVPTA